jgi:drug/metabolite transporter (DMT)-like permease
VPLWIAFSLGAAFLQNLRSALQKTLSQRIGVLGATFARFVFAAPWALLLVAGLLAGGAVPPGATPAFFGWAMLGAGAQIGATVLLLRLFALRDFAVGNAFAKTETVQAALFGALLLGDRVGALGWAAIAVGLVGLLLLSGPGGWRDGIATPAAGLGVAAGAAFALASIGYRGAALALEREAGFVLRASVTLAVVLALQTVAMAAWMAWRAPRTLGDVAAEWRIGALVGLAGMTASLGWFMALTLQTAALVKAVGQVELVFSWLTARLAFRERPSARETLGVALVGGAVVLLALGG